MDRLSKFFALLVSSALVLPALPALADPSELSLDAILEGFDEGPDEVGRSDSAPDPEGDGLERSLETTLSTSLGASYNVRSHNSSLGPSPDIFRGTDYSGLQRLRLRLDLQSDISLSRNWQGRLQAFVFYDFAYSLHGAHHYTQEVIDDYKLESEILDLWVEGSLASFLDLKLGRQVVNWGRSDSLRVNDIWNPLNNREPGLVDIEELRLPSTMLRFDAYWSDWQLTALIVPEIRYDYDPPPGSDFLPLPDPANLPSPPSGVDLATVVDHVLASATRSNREARGWGDSPEFGLSLTGVFRGWDASFYAARIYRNRPISVIDLTSTTGVEIYTTHDRVSMLGAGGNYTLGSWLFKAEAAFFDGVDYTFLRTNSNFANSASDLPYSSHAGKFGRIDWMAGIEYYGAGDITIALEIAHRHVIDHDPLLRNLPNYVYEDSVESALRISSQHMNARLDLNILGIVMANEEGFQGGILRVWGKYEILEALYFSAGYLHFFPSDQTPFDSWERNDRLFGKLKYSFP